MSRFLSLNSLSLFFLAIFLASVAAESVVGLHAYNEEAAQHGAEEVSWSRFVYSSEFGSAVLENWQSEWLQFCLFVIATVWLLQQGSPESKELDKAGLESDEEQKIGRHADRRSPGWAKAGGWRTAVYGNSFLIVMLTIFLGSWLAQSLTAWRTYNELQRAHDDPTVGWTSYLARPDFWEKTLQNWQSEFLAVGTMAVFTIFLRERGSPESKPVGAADEDTTSN